MCSVPPALRAGGGGECGRPRIKIRGYDVARASGTGFCAGALIFPSGSVIWMWILQKRFMDISLLQFFNASINLFISRFRFNELQNYVSSPIAQVLSTCAIGELNGAFTIIS